MDISCSFHPIFDFSARLEPIPILADLGYAADCDGIAAYDLKPADFGVDNLPEGRRQEQYFVVCVPQKTEEDARERSLFPTGPVAPRLLGCPGETVFDSEIKMCA